MYTYVIYSNKQFLFSALTISIISTLTQFLYKVKIDNKLVPLGKLETKLLTFIMVSLLFKVSDFAPFDFCNPVNFLFQSFRVFFLLPFILEHQFCGYLLSILVSQDICHKSKKVNLIVLLCSLSKNCGLRMTDMVFGRICPVNLPMQRPSLNSHWTK